MLKVAIVTDWLTVAGGAEEVIRRMLKLYPQAELFTTVAAPELLQALGYRKPVTTSYLQKLPRALARRHPFLLPLLPRAIESLDVSGYDLVISSSTFVGKAVLTHPGQLHICYCHSPTRYLWGEWQEYLREFPLPRVLKALLPRFFSRLRAWDRLAAERPDLYLANSAYIREAIAKYYRREATVIYPPVDTARFHRPASGKKSDYYLSLGRLVPQKRTDLLITAFLEMPEKKLKIAGSGRNAESLKALAHGAKNIEFLGYLPDEKIPELMGKAKALLYPQREDAGITAIEALAAGTPVIAYGEGGAKDMLQEGVTGVFFTEQTPDAIRKAIRQFEKKAGSYDTETLQKYAERFSVERFDHEFQEFVEASWQEFRKDRKIPDQV